MPFGWGKWDKDSSSHEGGSTDSKVCNNPDGSITTLSRDAKHRGN